MVGVTIWNLWIPKHSKNLLQLKYKKSVILDMRDPILLQAWQCFQTLRVKQKTTETCRALHTYKLLTISSSGETRETTSYLDLTLT